MFRRVWACVALCLALAGTAGAAGFSIYEQGAAATAQAGAFAARNTDPSAIFYNPAGIQGQGQSVSAGVTLISTGTTFYGDNPYPGDGYEAEQEPGFFYPPHLYYVHPEGEFTFGFGFFTPFGLGTEWKDGFAGRASSMKAVIQTFYFNPVVSYGITPELSVAVGAQMVMGTVEVERVAMTSVLTNWSDVADVALDGSGGPKFGFNAGIQYSPISQVRLGVSYRSGVELDYDGTAKFTAIDQTLFAAAGLPTETDVEASIAYPAIWSFGLALKPIERLTVEFDVLQMQWETFDELPITFVEEQYAALSEAIPEDYENSRSYRVGVEFMATDVLALRAGYLYDESPAPAAAVSTLLPDADRNSYMAGLGYTMGNFTVDVEYMYLPFNDRSTEQSSHRGFDGLFETHAHLYGFTLTYRF